MTLSQQACTSKGISRLSARLCWQESWVPKNAERLRKKTGVKILNPKKPVGCGYFGCVYLTDDPRWVVKVTQDHDEASLIQKVLDLRKEHTGVAHGPSRVLPGIVFVKNIFRGRKTQHGKRTFTPYVIVRENVAPATDSDIEDMEWYSDSKVENGAMTPGLNVVMKWAERFHEYKHYEKESAEATKQFIQWLVRLQREFPHVTEAMMTLFREHDLVLRDVHSQNVGRSIVDWGRDYRRPGQWIIHDLGVTPTVSRKNDLSILNPVRVNIVDPKSP